MPRIRPLCLFLLASGCAPGRSSRADDDGVATASLTLGGSEAGGSEADDAPRLDLGNPGDVPADSDGEACVAQMLAAEVEVLPVDVLLVIDTSGSMADAIAAVEQSINAEFAQILADSGLDYRVIVAADYPPGVELSVCIRMPLSGTNCDPPPPVPAIGPHYFHYDAATGSGALLSNILGWYSTPDPHGLAPDGYVDWLRPHASKVVLAMTDGASAAGDIAAGDAFDAALLALPGGLYGGPGARAYVFHTITSMPVNTPATAPWLASDPIAGAAASIQQVSVLSGGLRFPLSQTADFDVVFQQIAQGVVETTPIACSFAIPAPPADESIDPDTIEIEYLVGGLGPAEVFHQVAGPAACAADAFYIDSGMVMLCPAACSIVQADTMAQLQVRYGCDVGFEG